MSVKADIVPADGTHLFLGGHDLEMMTIAELAREVLGPERVHDAGLAWGARASAYIGPVMNVIARGGRAVLVELSDDLPEDLPRERIVSVDHHGDRAGRGAPSSLRQVFDLLALPPDSWTRRCALVEANDIGHMAALREIGATADEIRSIRDDDRRAQGVSSGDEAAARTAVSRAERRGDLTLVRVETRRMSPVTDFLEPEYGGPGPVNILVLAPDEAGFFGAGSVVLALSSEPGCWFGGALPARGFWGRTLDDVATGEVLAEQVAAFLNGR